MCSGVRVRLGVPWVGEDAVATSQRYTGALERSEEEKMGRDEDRDRDRDQNRPGKHDPEREGHVHEDTAKDIDPSKYGPPPDDDE